MTMNSFEDLSLLICDLMDEIKLLRKEVESFRENTYRRFDVVDDAIWKNSNS